MSRSMWKHKNHKKISRTCVVYKLHTKIRETIFGNVTSMPDAFYKNIKKKDWLSYRTICKKPYISSLISTCLNLIKSCCHYSLCHWNFSFLCKYWSIYHPVFTAKILKKCTKNSPYIYYKNIYSIIKSFSYSKLSTISENSISILTLLWSTPFMFLLAPWILTSDVILDQQNECRDITKNIVFLVLKKEQDKYTMDPW